MACIIMIVGCILLFQKPPKHSRAIFILGSVAPYSNESVVPQSPSVLSGDDRQVLTELDLPPDKWDNLNVLLAMYNRAEHYDVFSVQVSKPGMELSRSYVLEQVEYLLMNLVKKEGGKSSNLLLVCITCITARLYDIVH